MAIIQPFFQPDVTPETPLFAAFFNGFMERRTRDNLTIMSKFLDNQDSKYINDHIKMLQENRNELIKLKADIQRKEAEFGEKMALEIIKQQGQNSGKFLAFQTAKLKAAGDYFTAKQRKKENINRKISVLQGDKRSLNIGLKNTKAFNEIMEDTKRMTVGGAPQLNVLIEAIKANTTLDQDPNAFKDPDRKPYNIAVIFQQILKDDTEKNEADRFINTDQGKLTLKAALGEIGREVKNFDSLKPQKLLDEALGQFSQYTKSTTNSYQEIRESLESKNDAIALAFIDAQGTLVAKQAEKAKLEEQLDELQVGAEEIKAFEKKEPKLLKRLEDVDLEIKQIKTRIPKQSYAGANSAKRILRKFPQIAKSKDIAKDLQDEINMLSENIAANKLYRQQIQRDVIKQGPSRMFKGFRRNYLLETPFKRESKKGKRIRETLETMAKEKITKTGKGQRSKSFKNLSYGQAYNPRGTPGLQVGIAKEGNMERPFMVRQSGEYYYVDQTDDSYTSLLKVLGDINKSMYVPTKRSK